MGIDTKSRALKGIIGKHQDADLGVRLEDGDSSISVTSSGVSFQTGDVILHGADEALVTFGEKQQHFLFGKDGAVVRSFFVSREGDLSNADIGDPVSQQNLKSVERARILSAQAFAKLEDHPEGFTVNGLFEA